MAEAAMRSAKRDRGRYRRARAAVVPVDFGTTQDADEVETMVPAWRMVFWCSLVAAIGAGIVGKLVAPSMVAVKGTPAVAADETADPATASAEPSAEAAVRPAPVVTAGDRAAEGLRIGLIAVFVIGAFAAALHGGSVAAAGSPPAAAPLWGLVPATMIIASAAGFALWIAWAVGLEPISLGRAPLVPLAACGLGAWEVGFFGVLPWSRRAAAH
ncbi:MAG TPA: hypothetical protein DCQ98_03690 [Planctomycetaceae bacterium]|nr:hypothetical protein [Planctomycetaceae bacterium]